MTLALSALVAAGFAGAVRIFWAWLANCDDAERDHATDEILRRRYQQQPTSRTWR